jgi:hypothetical protein
MLVREEVEQLLGVSRRRRLVFVAEVRVDVDTLSDERLNPRRDRADVVVGVRGLAETEVAVGSVGVPVVDADSARQLEPFPRLVPEVEGEADRRVEGAEQSARNPSSRGWIAVTRTTPSLSPRSEMRSSNTPNCRAKCPGNLTAKRNDAGVCSAQRTKLPSAGSR